MSLLQKDDPKKNKKAMIDVKIEWIFGIRKDLYPNLCYISKGTFIYPASHYVVIFNYEKSRGHQLSGPQLNGPEKNVQHFIEGECHSKGITAIAGVEISNKAIPTKLVAVAETVNDFAKIKFYTLSDRGGMQNKPEKHSELNLDKYKINQIYAMKFTNRKADDKNNYFVAFGVKKAPVIVQKPGYGTQKKVLTETKKGEDTYFFIVKKWDSNEKEFCWEIPETEIPKTVNECKKFEISFSTSLQSSDEDELEFCLASEKFIDFFLFNSYANIKAMNQINDNANEIENNIQSTYIYEGENEREEEDKKPEEEKNEEENEEENEDLANGENLGNDTQKNEEEKVPFEILSHCWINDGLVAVLTNQDEKIEIIKPKVKNSYHVVTKDFLEQNIIQKNKKNEQMGDYTLLAPYQAECYEGFIAAGTKGKLHFYLRKMEKIETQNNQKSNQTDNQNDSDFDDDEEEDYGLSDDERRKKAQKYILKFKKDPNCDYLPGINEPINSDNQPGSKNTNSDKILIFDYHSIITIEDEPYIFASTENNDLIKITTDHKTIKDGPVEYCIAPFHAETVIGMDCCINKPYLITCSKDHSVKVWDYSERVQLLSKTYEEELYSIAFHPSGMYALLSADEKIHQLAIYYDAIELKKNQDISNLKSSSKDLKFSNLGHLFAFDEGTTIKIFDFLNMQPYTGPPDVQPHTKNFGNSTTGLKCLSWGPLDKHLYIGGTDCLFDWRLKDEPYSSIKKPLKNYLSVIYSNQTNEIIASSEDKKLTRLSTINTEGEEQDIPYSVAELNPLSYSDVLFCKTTTNKNIKKDKNIRQHMNDKVEDDNEINTSTLLIFYEYSKSNQFKEIPAHHGETIRVRLNNEGTKAFTCGADGCINIYSIELQSDNYSDTSYDTQPKFTKTVLIDKSSNKTRETNKKDLPAKREDLLKKTTGDRQEDCDNKKKDLEELKNRNAIATIQEEGDIKTLEDNKKRNEKDYEDILITQKRLYKTQEDEKERDNQIEIAKLTKEVDEIREEQRKVNEDGLNEKRRREVENQEKLNKLIADFEIQKESLEKDKRQKEGMIEKVKNDRKEDGKALDEVNSELVRRIGNSVNELKAKIEELGTHYSHDIKKKKEEKEKLEQEGQKLVLEEKKLQEDIKRQETKKQKQEQTKKEVEDKMAKITKRISEIENKIIECKKSHTYLEKCKFVLSYKIQELKKESAPIEKVLEDLQRRTKEDELSLSKYNREFDIISHKVVNLDDLKEKTKIHEKNERDLLNEINNFKNDLYKMLSHIDDFDQLKRDFMNLREKYLGGYKSDVQDHELEGEFANQKSKMKNRVIELQEDLINLRKKHKENIRDNRDENNQRIEEIQKLKKDIKAEKKNREDFNSDQKHANAVAEIKAGEYIKQLMMQDIPISSKIELFKKKLEIKQIELQKLRRDVEVKSYEGKRINYDGTPYNTSEM